ncbi:MAG: MOSC domain-containing protein [Cyclobacteriaceae bacterium]
MHVTGLTIYPIKSTTGLHREQFKVLKTGLQYDRQWVVIDQDGKAITGRQNASLLAFSTNVGAGKLQISHKDGSKVTIPLNRAHNDGEDVQIFSSVGHGVEVSAEANKYLSDKLNQQCTLLEFNPHKTRMVQKKHGGQEKDEVLFADMNPILLVSEGSLNDLNARLDLPITMQHFRPNIVIDGCASFEEDRWKKIRIGECEFRIVQKCERCVFTTIDPLTGIKSPNGEPLRTLAKYRRTKSGDVAFGMHAIPTKLGTIKINDKVEVLG